MPDERLIKPCDATPRMVQPCNDPRQIRGCGVAPCPNCTQTPRRIIVIASGITICSDCQFYAPYGMWGKTAFSGDLATGLNGTHVLEQLESNPCWYASPVTGQVNRKWWWTECVGSPAQSNTVDGLWTVYLENGWWSVRFSNFDTFISVQYGAYNCMGIGGVYLNQATCPKYSGQAGQITLSVE